MAQSVTTLGQWRGEKTNVAAVESALSDLRRHEVRAAVRTAVLTLVVLAADGPAMNEAMEVVREIGPRHPSRTVMLIVQRGTVATSLDADVSVHCIERDGR